MELWDAYDEHLNKLDLPPLVRGEVIPDDVYHLVCDILVRHEDGSYLLMKRHPQKHHGGMWEATAGGSATVGEDAHSCAKRELYEETGIPSGEFVLLGSEVNKERHTVYCTFLCTTSADKNSVTLEEGETVGYKWVQQKELLSMSPTDLVTTRVQKYL